MADVIDISGKRVESAIGRLSNIETQIKYHENKLDELKRLRYTLEVEAYGNVEAAKMRINRQAKNLDW